MFYKDIPKKEIPDDIKKIYLKDVKPYKGQLVIYNHEVVELVDLLRDDAVDQEWCYRVLHFPSQNTHQVSDCSIICGKVIPLKGVISAKDYKDMVWSWRMNEEIFPYRKDYRKKY
jgi:hypothetical protein